MCAAPAGETPPPSPVEPTPAAETPPPSPVEPTPPIDCGIGDWEDWGECNEACGGGIARRTRTLTEPLHGGEPCPTKPGTTDHKICNIQDCPEDCIVEDWSDWD